MSVMILAAAMSLGTFVQIPSSAPPPPGRLVDIGGRRLHIQVQGTGSPAVIVESGNSSFSVDFALVQPKIANFTKICTYDRAGYAWSDPGPTRGSVPQTVDDLHLLLRKAGIKPPYVFLGASVGGIYTRAYQRRYPEEVVGMVLDDPTSDGGFSYFVNGKDKPIYEITRAELQKAFEPLLKNPRPITLDEKIEDPYDRLPPKLGAARLWASRKYDLESNIQNDMVSTESWREEFTALRTERLSKKHLLGDMPFILLGRHQKDEAERQRDLKDMLALSSAGKLIIAENSGHEIHLYKPDLVVNSVRKVVQAARKRMRH